MKESRLEKKRKWYNYEISECKMFLLREALQIAKSVVVFISCLNHCWIVCFLVDPSHPLFDTDETHHSAC